MLVLLPGTMNDDFVSWNGITLPMPPNTQFSFVNKITFYIMAIISYKLAKRK